MAQNKKSVILYCDTIHTFEALEDAEAGKLIKHFLRYVNDLNPEPPDKLTQIAFEPIKQQLKRDLVKWGEIVEKRSFAGKESAKKRQQMSTHVKSVQQTSTHSTVTDTVTVNVNEKIDFSVFWSLYPRKEGKKKSVEKWNKLKLATQQKIIDTLPKFLEGKDLKFVPMPETYFNKERWDDEVTVLTQSAPPILEAKRTSLEEAQALKDSFG